MTTQPPRRLGIVDLQLVTSHYRERFAAHLPKLGVDDVRDEITSMLLDLLDATKGGPHEAGVRAAFEGWKSTP